MELKGFSIASDCIALEANGQYLDLHNNFDFEGLSYEPTLQVLELRWIKASGNWVPASTPWKLRIRFSGVTFFKCHERDPELPLTEDKCLDSIGFLSNDLITEMHGFSGNLPSTEKDHLIVIFMSGASIKVSAAMADLAIAECA